MLSGVCSWPDNDLGFQINSSCNKIRHRYNIRSGNDLLKHQSNCGGSTSASDLSQESFSAIAQTNSNSNSNTNTSSNIPTGTGLVISRLLCDNGVYNDIRVINQNGEFGHPFELSPSLSAVGKLEFDALAQCK